MSPLDLAAWVATVVPFTAASIAYATRPLRKLRDDLAPLTDRNSDGESVFDEVRKQQKEDTATLQQLAAEFPKNGVPARTAFDAVKLDVASLLTKQAGIVADLAEVRADVRAHEMLHRAGFIPKPRSGEDT